MYKIQFTLGAGFVLTELLEYLLVIIFLKGMQIKR